MRTTKLFCGPDGLQAFPANHRYAWPAELDLMAWLAELNRVHRWASWRRDPYTATSRQHVTVYRKDAPGPISSPPIPSARPGCGREPGVERLVVHEVLGHLGVDVSGRDRVDLQPVSGPLGRHGPGEVAQCLLRGGVGPEVGRARSLCTEQMLMIFPSRRGTFPPGHGATHHEGAVRSMSGTRCQLPRLAGSSGSRCWTPALLTRTPPAVLQGAGRRAADGTR